MNRTASVLAATIAALLLSAAPAAAQEWEPVPVPTGTLGLYAPSEDQRPDTGEPPVPEMPECVTEPVEIEPGLWDCYLEPVPTPDPDAPTEEPAPAVEPEPEPEPEPVIVVGDGDWGWSDAREAYSA